ncbi:MAG: hypothetical protein HWN80_18645 [Candidatus Lokiarchaeota archaeon]|nr:hypothetical protein [Candidatus Lokiarchaeota archaeon]
MVINIEKIKKQILDFLSKKDMKNAKKAVKLLIDLIRSIEIKDIPQFGEIFADFARNDPKYSANNMIIGLQLMLRKRSQPVQEKFYELDKYLIEKYCLFEGETILDSFYGSIQETYQHVKKGQIFLTNQRIIACGLQVLTSIVQAIPGVVMPTKYGYAKNFNHMMTGGAIRESLCKPALEAGIMSYGFVYPIHNAYHIKKKGSGVQYILGIDYEVQGKTYGARLDVQVSIDKIKGDKVRMEEIKKNLLEALNENQ